MISKTYFINSFEELHSVIQESNPKTAVYRGVKDATYTLTPKVGRIKPLEIHGDSLERFEKKILRLFKERAVAYLDIQPANDWEWLALAQHHGLSTRLLDWTRNPLVAAYFVIEDTQSKTDGAIYLYTPNLQRFAINPEEHKEPFKIDIVRIFNPPHVTRRISAQDSLFTVHHRPQEAMEDTEEVKEIKKVILPAPFKEKLRHILHNYGIHKASLFPGLDGLAEYLNIWHSI